MADDEQDDLIAKKHEAARMAARGDADRAGKLRQEAYRLHERAKARAPHENEAPPEAVSPPGPAETATVSAPERAVRPKPRKR